MTDHTPTPGTARLTPEVLADALALEMCGDYDAELDGSETAGLTMPCDACRAAAARVVEGPAVRDLLAAARESIPAPTEATGLLHAVKGLRDRVRSTPHRNDPFHVAMDIADDLDRIIADEDAARTAPASEVAATNAEARLAAISELVETGQQFMTRNRFTDALRAILRDEAAATNAQSVINAAHVAQEVLRQNERHFAELLAEADRIDGVMVNGANVAAVLRNMVNEHEAHA